MFHSQHHQYSKQRHVYEKMHFIPITYIHVVPFLLTNIVCHSYVTKRTHHKSSPKS